MNDILSEHFQNPITNSWNRRQNRYL